MSIFAPAPEPASALGRLRILSPTAAVRVSPLQLGAMSIGSSWSGFMGSMDKPSSFALLDAFVAKGGNFIDTANNYQDEESETWLGEWMAERNIRDSLVIATKYTTDYRAHALGKAGAKSVNFSGNGMKSMHLSVRDSLKKLKTDYIDLLYVHWWDHATSISEVMDGLHTLVQQGKVLYLGISDSPAWIVSAANTYARAHGKTPFSVYQGQWNVLSRDFERDIIPMARSFGMALAPWDVLSAGRITSRQHHAEKAAAGETFRAFGRASQELTDVENAMIDTLEVIAKELGTESVTAVAIAYVMAKAAYVFPIIGGRKIEHLEQNIGALSLRLSDEQIKRIEDVKPFDVGFPHNFVGMDPKEHGVEPNLLSAMSARVDLVKNSRAVGY